MRMDRTADWYWEQDCQYRFTKFEATHRASGEGVSNTRDPIALGACWQDLHPLNFQDGDLKAHLDWLAVHEPFFNLELHLLLENGNSQWVSLCGVPVFGGGGKFLGYRGVGKDISQQKHLQAVASEAALYDPLTGLGSQRLLMERLHSARINSVRSQAYAALIRIDIDRIQAADRVVAQTIVDGLLIQIGVRLCNSVRESDTVARIGARGFVVLAIAVGESTKMATQNVQRLADKMAHALSLEFRVAEHACVVENCMGITLFNGNDVAVAEVLARAESALAEAKLEGRNTIHLFDPMLETQALERKRTQRELSYAIEHEQLVLHYQPIVDLHRTTVGYEALLRWNHPAHGLLAPNKFIDIAERSGLIIPMGEWVLAQACHQLALFAANSATRELTIAVNLSARQLAHPSLVPSVHRILAASGAPANRLKLEITESMLLTEMEKTVAKLQQLSQIGIQFSLDDFGTGYSSLNYLKKLPLSVLKIDQSFVKELLIDPVDAAIVNTIMQLAKSLGLSVIAEGVELEGQRKVLADMGCREFQGYLFGKPATLP